MPGNVPVPSDDVPAHSAVFSRVYSLYVYLLYIFVAIMIFFFLKKKKATLLLLLTENPWQFPVPQDLVLPLSRISVSTVGTCQVHAMSQMQPSASDSPASIPCTKLPCPGSDPQNSQASV